VQHILIQVMFVDVDFANQIPIVDDEMKKAAGDEKEEDIQMLQGVVQKLVTADGTYASQSAFSAMLPVKKDQVRFVIFMIVICICFLTGQSCSILSKGSYIYIIVQHFTLQLCY